MNRNNHFTYRTIQTELIIRLNQRHDDNYYQELKSIFKYIISKIKEYPVIYAGKDDDISISSENICKKMEEDSKKLLCFVDYYLKGNISSCYNAFQKWWKNIHLEYFEESYDTSIFYRMRKREDGEKEYSYEDLLHIPFQLRGKITNQRYSICGYPCLYISTSLYQTWEELRRPYLQYLYAVAMRFTKSLSIFDMRLMRDIMSEKQLRCYLQRLPLIIACSVKVRNDKDSFKPEYIIPQTLLHTIKKERIDGILYSSIRTKITFYNKKQWEDFSKNENIVIPVRSNPQKGLCEQLQQMIEVSDCKNFEQEMIKGTIKIETSDIYEKTLLGQLENELKNSMTYFPLSSEGIKGKIGFGLNQGRQIKHILI